MGVGGPRPGSAYPLVLRLLAGETDVSTEGPISSADARFRNSRWCSALCRSQHGRMPTFRVIVDAPDEAHRAPGSSDAAVPTARTGGATYGRRSHDSIGGCQICQGWQ